MISDNTAGSNLSNKAVVTAVDYAAANTIDVAYYEATLVKLYAAASKVLSGSTDLSLRKELWNGRTL